MNIFYDSFPCTVTISGVDYPIVTDFRDWIRFVDMMKSDLQNAEKMAIALMYFTESIPDNIVEAMHALIDFFEAKEMDSEVGESDNESNCRKNVFSYQSDGKYIYAAFQHDYGIDLQKSHMHWWRFRILFDGLGNENEIKQRIHYRSIDPRTITDPNEKKRILRIQKQIALPQNILSDYEIGSAFT